MSSASNSSSSSKTTPAKQPAKKNKKQKSKRKSRPVTNLLPSLDLVGAYVDSLNNPFENQGCKLGWGCMVPTNIVTAYAKGSTNANADGSCAFSLIPNPSQFIQVANGGVNVSFATVGGAASATDATAIDANFVSGRVISGGIRAYPNIAMTSAPGVCYVGSIPALQFQQAQALTPQDLSGSPFLKQFRAYEGGTAVARPQDTVSFDFVTKNVSASTVYGTTDDLPVSTPFICFTGIGNATSVYYEACINVEVISKSVHGSTALTFNDKAQPGKTLSDYWASAERMWSAVKPLVAAAGRYGAQTALASSLGVIGSYRSKKEIMTSSSIKSLSG